MDIRSVYKCPFIGQQIRYVRFRPPPIYRYCAALIVPGRWEKLAQNKIVDRITYRMNWTANKVEFGNVVVKWIGAYRDQVSQAQTIVDDLQSVFVEVIVSAV